MTRRFRRARRQSRLERMVNGFVLGCFMAMWFARVLWRGWRAG